MKKMVCILLLVCILFCNIAPISVFAEEKGDLEKAIKIAKGKFPVVQNFTEFRYDIYTLEDEKIWNMCWYNKENKDGSIEISINSKGEILSYYFYKYEKDYKKKLPKYSKEEGKEIADRFINKVDPNILVQLKYIEDDVTTISERTYRYRYIRMVNHIPFYENDVRIEVNKDTGEVEKFYRNWNSKLLFPKPEDIISLEEAQKAFQEKLGLELIYRYQYDQKTIKPYLVYTTKYNQYTYIDAFTGEKVKIPYPIIYDRGENLAKEEVRDAVTVQLNPQELKAIKEASKLIEKEEAEKIARNTKVLALTKGFKLSSANLSRDWPIRESFTWHLYFHETKEEKGKKVYSYVNVGIDAVTGKIKSFYISHPYKEGEQAVFDKEASKKAVERFLKAFVPDQYVQTVYRENDDLHYGRENRQKPLFYHFTYIRKVNDIPFKDHYINVEYNGVTGKIKSFHIRWFDVDFPSPKKVVPMDLAYEKMFQNIGLELRYKKNTDNENPKVKLIYGIKEGKPVNFDAENLQILNFDGSIYKEEKDLAYTDIEKHEAREAIQALATYGIGFEEDVYKPDEKIIQKDFFRLFIKTLENDFVKKEEDLYTYLKREEIIKENEQAPNKYVTKEEAAKFMIRALKYDDVAKIKGIYKYPFTDIKEASSDLLGHITIAHGLGIVKGNDGKFQPKKQITRGEAAVMIYQYLKR